MNIQDMQDSYRRQLRRLYEATKYLQNPNALALIINKRIAKNDDGALIRNIIQTRFATGGTSGGFSWRPLADATQDERKRLGYAPAGPILIRSGFLVRGATEGKITWDADQIVLTFQDGPAPNYKGKGKATRKKINRAAAHAIDQARATGMDGGSGGTSNRLSDYAGQLNADRPFYGAPNAAELAPIFEYRDRLIAAAMTAIVNGQNMYQALETTD